eukprot:gnl/TRDRNA2_/TRDRNA2_176747_c0_seq27.p1 gnl/TRDRNA2_/TRDRNA2_176747_c0~~gnl/TRDRNA2_/TRDRNA2_176747_c0_seq27.p1  ORF type:complete len:521 (+),score=112.15 gnl/TRDRNA2_/TRDRNA2_176747_c0_seq27:42-1565(+)
MTDRVEKRAGKVAVTGRYHRLPKRITDDYDLNKNDVVGSGMSGDVHIARGKTDGLKYAVKQFSLSSMKADKRQELQDEVEVFLGMDHPHICRLFDVYESDDQLSLVMECMEGGELFDRVIEKKIFSEKDAADATYQMLLALNYSHGIGVVHRDIKLENLMYESKGGNHLKLIDFGFSKIWDPNVKMAVSCGTLSYVAPEVLRKSYSGSQCDMWSAGVVVFILISGYMPFSGSQETQCKNIKAGIFKMDKKGWLKVSEDSKDFVRNLMVVDPAERMTAATALAHKWIAQRDKIEVSLVDQDTVNALESFSRESKFRRAALSMMAWCLSYEERKAVRDAFLEMDKDKTGTIKLWELKKVLSDEFDMNDNRTTQIFEALDSNHDGTIHYSDYLAAMCSTRIALHDDLLKKAFNKFDADSSGFITIDNLRVVLGESFSEQEIAKLIKELDENHDGQISYEEFIHYCRGAGADMRQRWTTLCRGRGSTVGLAWKHFIDLTARSRPQCCTLCH